MAQAVRLRPRWVFGRLQKHFCGARRFAVLEVELGGLQPCSDTLRAPFMFLSAGSPLLLSGNILCSPFISSICPYPAQEVKLQ